MRNRAAYMREYRARRKGENLERVTVTPKNGAPVEFAGFPHEIIADCLERVTALQEEVARLKRELAARPLASVNAFTGKPSRNPYREFRPVPKPGGK